MNGSISLDAVWSALEDLRARRPLVHNITNYVAMGVSANVLLAVGASPAMVHAVEEVEDFVAISDTLCINIGTLSPPWVAAMHAATTRAMVAKIPWLLDPVGCGATPYRTSAARELLAQRPSVVRGNAGEIMSLAGEAGATKGVDSLSGADEAMHAANLLARRCGAVIAVTGAVDNVTNGESRVAIHGGDALMPLSTALGCSLSAVTAAFLAVRPPLAATVAALAVFGAAGSIAAARCRGPGHLPAEICDALHGMTREALAAHVRLA